MARPMGHDGAGSGTPAAPAAVPSNSYATGTTVGGSGGAYDFADNVDVLNDVVTALGEAKTNLQASIDNIYDLLGGTLHSSWQGTVYNAFKERCDFYHPALDELVSLIGAFEGLFDKVSGEAAALDADVASSLEI